MDNPTPNSTPMFLVNGDETHKIEFPDGSWVAILRAVSGIQRKRWADAAVISTTKWVTTGTTRKGKPIREQQTSVDYSQERFLAAQLRDIVTGWSADEPLDVARIRDPFTTTIVDKFDELNPSADDDDEGSAMGESDAGSNPSSSIPEVAVLETSPASLLS